MQLFKNNNKQKNLSSKYFGCKATEVGVESVLSSKFVKVTEYLSFLMAEVAELGPPL